MEGDINQHGQTIVHGAEGQSKWGIKDTEFLIRLLISSKIDGGDLEVASSVLKKLKTLHTTLLSQGVNI